MLGEMQKNLVEQYLRVHDYPSLRYMEMDTGIQKTRIFRILTSLEMRLSEYERFQQSIINKLDDSREGKGDLEGKNLPYMPQKVVDLAQECSVSLSYQSLMEIEDFMARKLTMQTFKRAMGFGSRKTKLKYAYSKKE